MKGKGQTKSALIVVDIQNDFCPGGSLAVPRGDEIIPCVNRLMEQFKRVAATQDWHPPDHMSFASNHPGKRPGEVMDIEGRQQILWPDHCIQRTKGADFAPGLAWEKFDRVFKKGDDPKIDSYSGFFDNDHKRATGLGDYLNKNGVRRLYICGLAADYCVKFTAEDAAELGFETFVVTDATRGVNLKEGDTDRAFRVMPQAGIGLIRSGELIAT